MKHTPGPWVLVDDFEVFQEQNNDYPRQAGYYVTTLNPDTTADDARLIAAAPEMLEELRQVVELFCDPIDPQPWTEDIRALLARIQGGSV